MRYLASAAIVLLLTFACSAANDVRIEPGGQVETNQNTDPVPKQVSAEKNYDITIENNTLTNCDQSFVYNSGDKPNAPTSATIQNNIIKGDGETLIRVIDDIVTPTYSNNYYWGGTLGLTPTPSGISTSSLTLSTNNDGLQLQGTYGAQDIDRLTESECGPTTFYP